jgi:membrane protease YdiL (CAAX protease family)
MIIGIGAAELVSLAVPLDDSLERTFGQVSEVAVVPFILFIAVVPGLIEEAFFRGYIQRRLRTRWPAWAAVTMTAGLFGLMHIEPAYIAFAYVIGIWLGVVASQTGSVWLSALCHASINAAAGIWNLGTRFKYIPESPPVAAVGAVSILALGCFLASVWILSSRPSMRPADGDVARGRDEGEDNSEHLDLG